MNLLRRKACLARVDVLVRHVRQNRRPFRRADGVHVEADADSAVAGRVGVRARSRTLVLGDKVAGIAPGVRVVDNGVGRGDGEGGESEQTVHGVSSKKLQ